MAKQDKASKDSGSTIKVAAINTAGGVGIAIISSVITYLGTVANTKNNWEMKLLEEQTKRVEIDKKYELERGKVQELRATNASLQQQLADTVTQYTRLIDGVVQEIGREQERREGPSQWVRIVSTPE